MTDVPEQRSATHSEGQLPAVATRTARASAAQAALLCDGREPLKHIWRYVILQLLDDYTSALSYRGIAAAAQMWRDAPEATGEPRIDAALAALAEHLARRDGWAPPAWSQESTRDSSEWWFVTDLAGLHPRALVESPVSFRKRGVFITSDALVRA